MFDLPELHFFNVLYIKLFIILHIFFLGVNFLEKEDDSIPSTYPLFNCLKVCKKYFPKPFHVYGLKITRHKKS